MNKKTMLLPISKKNKKKSRFYLERMRAVKEDDNSLYFIQDEARIVTLQWKLNK